MLLFVSMPNGAFSSAAPTKTITKNKQVSKNTGAKASSQTRFGFQQNGLGGRRRELMKHYVRPAEL